MQVVSETLVERIVRAVIEELRRRSVEVTEPTAAPGPTVTAGTSGSVEIDFSEYRTPVLTERQVRAVGPDTHEIVVPEGTHCTTGAKDLMRKRKLTLKTKSPTH